MFIKSLIKLFGGNFMITREVILVFSSLKNFKFLIKKPLSKSYRVFEKHFFEFEKKPCFFKNFINKFRRKLTRLKSLFSSLKIFSRPCVRILRFFPATQFVVSILTKKLSIFFIGQSWHKNAKNRFLQIKYSNKCHLSRQLGGGGVPLQQSRGFKTPLPSQKTNQIQLTDKKKTVILAKNTELVHPKVLKIF